MWTLIFCWLLRFWNCCEFLPGWVFAGCWGFTARRMVYLVWYSCAPSRAVHHHRESSLRFEIAYWRDAVLFNCVKALLRGAVLSYCVEMWMLGVSRHCIIYFYNWLDLPLNSTPYICVEPLLRRKPISAWPRLICVEPLLCWRSGIVTDICCMYCWLDSNLQTPIWPLTSDMVWPWLDHMTNDLYVTYCLLGFPFSLRSPCEVDRWCMGEEEL